MNGVLLSTFMFIPRGETEVIKLKFYLSDISGVWNVDNNHIYLNQALYSRWRDCMNHPPQQKKFFDQLRKISNDLIG